MPRHLNLVALQPLQRYLGPMQILLGLITLLVALGVWAWRRRMAHQGLDVESDIERTVASAPPRAAFRYKAGKGGLDLIEDPREAAAILMMQVALARGGRLTPRQTDIIEAEIREHFEYTHVEAESLAAHAAWVCQTCPPAKDAMTQLSRMIVNSTRLGPKEVVDLDAMLVAVSEAEELPTRAQLLLLQVYRDTAGLKT